MDNTEKGVANAKLDSDKIPCTLIDMQRLGVQTTYWSVDADGDPVEYLDDTDSDFYEEQFYCANCTNHFDNWNEAKEHLG